MAIRGSRSERQAAFIVVLVYVFVGVIYVGLILPFLSGNQWFITMNPVGAYVIWNVGYLFIFAGVFGLLVDLIGGKGDVVSLIMNGFAGFLLFSWVFDMLQPPLAWLPSGALAIMPGAELENTAVDYMWGWIFQQFGVSGPLLFWLVYGLIPVVGIILAFLILAPRQFLKETGLRR